MDKRTWIFIAVLIGIICGGLAYRHFAQDVDSRGATRLMRALEENNTDKTLKLLTVEDINVRDKTGQTALFYAAKHATDPKVIYKLIVAGASVLDTDKNGNTALTTAARHNPSAAVVTALAKHGPDSAQQQVNKNKALIQAAKHNTSAVIKALLKVQASPAPQGPDAPGAAVYLTDNENLTEQEKTDYRQVMLMLEILEAREQFAKSVQERKGKKTETAAEKTAEKPVAPSKVAPVKKVADAAKAEEKPAPPTPETAETQPKSKENL